MRTEKSPLRIACSACSRSSEGLVLPLPEGFGLPARRAADGVAEPRSLMEFPLRNGRARIRASRVIKPGAESQIKLEHRQLVPPAGTAPKSPKVPPAIGSMPREKKFQARLQPVIPGRALPSREPGIQKWGSICRCGVRRRGPLGGPEAPPRNDATVGKAAGLL